MVLYWNLLLDTQSNLPKINLGLDESVIELRQEKVDNPLEFLRVLKSAFQDRGNDKSKFNVTHLIVTIHIYYSNTITGENIYSKLSLVDLAGSEGLTVEDDNGDHVTDLLHVMNSISTYAKFYFSFLSTYLYRLGDVLLSLTLEKDSIPYENSMLARILVAISCLLWRAMPWRSFFFYFRSYVPWGKPEPPLLPQSSIEANRLCLL